MSKSWNVYLAGEIHSDWRREIREAIGRADLPVDFSAPVTDHGASDEVGVSILGPEEKSFWKDHKGAGVNSIRTRVLIRDADVVVVRFGEKYRQWNAAFEAGFASALGKPIIMIHPEEYDHALKEVDAAAAAVARSPDQVAQILQYIIGQA